MIAIIDYGAGNLRSVVNALSRLGYEANVTALKAAKDMALKALDKGRP